MGLSFFLVLYFNVTIVSLLFWTITFLYNYTSFSWKSIDKFEVFECGFLTINKTTVSVPLNSIIVCSLVVLYEIEFLLIVPFLFNSYVVFLASNLLVIYIFTFVTFTLILDYFFKSTNWVY